MKIVKMSLVAALLIGSSAFAVDNVKVSGDAKLFYSTTDNHGKGDLLNKASSMGQAALGLGATANLSDSVIAGAHLTALSTLGLEGQLVNAVWEGTNGVSDYAWYDEAWLATTAGKTTVKIGRQSLDTPLVFTEDWSVAKNTFEAAVLINSDLPDTTLVGAYVGGHNGGDIAVNKGVVVAPVNASGTTNFSQFYEGAFALGVVNNSIKPLTAQLWYYNAKLPSAVGASLKATWIQADVDLSGILLGAQYTTATVDAGTAGTAMAVKVGYSNHKDLHAYVAYSTTGKDGGTGGNLSGSGQSKLYTEAWWSYGYVTAKDTTALTLEVQYEAGFADLGVFYTTADNAAANDAGDLSEFTLTASRTYGGLETTVAVMNETANGGDAQNALQVYLTYNF